MGIYLNPNNVNFQRDLESEIYIDKSMLLSVLNVKINTNQKLMCVTRPRRFGKSMAENMMAAYYSKVQTHARCLKVSSSLRTRHSTKISINAMSL